MLLQGKIQRHPRETNPHLDMDYTTWWRYVAVALALLIMGSSSAFSAEEPEWVSKKKPDDSLYKYYVGRSSTHDERQAFNECFADAMEQAVKAVFGVKTKIETQTYEETTAASFTKRVLENSGEVVVKGFEQADYYRSGTTTYVLFRYSKEDIELEKKRLREEKQSDKSRFSTYKGSSRQKGGVEVSTNPEDIQLFIDDYPWGTTNTRLDNKFEPGKHTLRLEHPHYNTVFEQVIIVPNDVVSISKTMTRAEGSIRVTTYPVSNAEIFVDERNVGRSPLEFRAPAGIEIKVRAEHEETETVETTTVASKSGIREVPINLSLKPSYITISSIPAGADVSVNGRRVGITPLLKYEVPPHQSLSITLRKNGHVDKHDYSQGLKGGEERTLPPISLQAVDVKPLNESEIMIVGTTTHDGKPLLIKRNPWETSVGLAFISSPFKDFDGSLGGFYFNAGRTFLNVVGIKIGGSWYAENPNQNKEGDEKLYGNELNLSLPIVMGIFRVQPEIGRFNGKASVVTETNAYDLDNPRETKDDIKSNYFGGLAGLCFRGDKGAYLEVYLGLRKYDNYEGYEARICKNLSLGIGVSF